ncbi:cytochrome P450 [Mycena rebaudengoi]|nr:cytochrome P450 [Mycena rebaudengoi]KAJ7252216.1 cytochrome P450 [Mycena rebaudengoi]
MASTAVLCVLVVFLFYAIQRVWRRVFSPLDNVPGPPRKSLVTGNLTQYYDPDGSEFHKDLEENYGQVVKIHGLFGARQLYVFDPSALYTILVKDQDVYGEMPEILSMISLTMGKGIFSTARDEHRKYRKIMLPAFSTANLRGMVPGFYEVAEKVRDNLIAPYVADGPKRLDFNSISSRTSLEFIGRNGIGYSFDPMLPGQTLTDRYAKSIRGLLPAAFSLALLMPLLPILDQSPFPAFRRFMINLIPLPALHELRDIVDYTDATAAKLVKDRKAAIESGDLHVKEDAKDLMSILMRSNMSAEPGMHLTDDELVAATGMVVTAATDTTSGAMTRLFNMLALYPEMQEKLRAEILAAPEHPDHDTIVGLPYLDGFVREVLRLYPSASPSMFRIAEEDAVLPLGTPITGVDGNLMSSITAPKGTLVYIAINAANHSKEIWGYDALEFKPERWKNGKAISAPTRMCGIYGNTMTFIGGGRSCIGFKFAQLEIKTLLFILLRAFKFSQPDPAVKWRLSGIVLSPYIGNEQRLPILVERLTA